MVDYLENLESPSRNLVKIGPVVLAMEKMIFKDL